MVDTTDSNEYSLSKGNVKRLLKDESGFRVSDGAALQVIVEEEERIKNVANAARIIAEEAGRKTILERDIRKAWTIYKRMKE